MERRFIKNYKCIDCRDFYIGNTKMKRVEDGTLIHESCLKSQNINSREEVKVNHKFL